MCLLGYCLFRLLRCYAHAANNLGPPSELPSRFPVHLFDCNQWSGNIFFLHVLIYHGPPVLGQEKVYLLSFYSYFYPLSSSNSDRLRQYDFAHGPLHRDQNCLHLSLYGISPSISASVPVLSRNLLNHIKEYSNGDFFPRRKDSHHLPRHYRHKCSLMVQWDGLILHFHLTVPPIGNFNLPNALLHFRTPTRHMIR